MAMGHDHGQSVAPVGAQLDFLAIAAVVEQADIGLVVGHGTGNVGAHALLQAYIHLRVLGQKALQLRW